MSNFITYLTFNGNCKEAMLFYHRCFGGKLTLQTVGESPMCEELPKKMKDCILYSSIENGNLTLLATDMVDENGFVVGNNMAIMVECDSKNEMENFYKILCEDSKFTHPIKETFWGALFGGVTDKYNNQWLFHYKNSAQLTH